MARYFDLEKARSEVDESGERTTSDEEILAHLRQLHPSYQFQQALDMGTSEQEIMEYLSDIEPEDFSGSPDDTLLERAPAVVNRAVTRGMVTAIPGAIEGVVYPPTLTNDPILDMLNPLNVVGAVPRAVDFLNPLIKETTGVEFPMIRGSTEEARTDFNEFINDPNVQGFIDTASSWNPDYDPSVIRNENFLYRSIDDLPPGERKIAVPAEFVGASAPFMMMPNAAAAGVSRFGGPTQIEAFSRSPIGGALTNPRLFNAIEGSAVVGGATAGAMAQVAAPDNENIRMLAESVGGFASPIAVAARLSGGPVGALGRAVSATTKEGASQIAAQRVSDMIRESGGDPEVVARTITERVNQLEAEGVTPDSLPTAGQLSENDILLGIEANLARTDQPFNLRRNRQAEANLRALRETSTLLESTGDPMALQTAARLREAYGREAIQAELDNASTEAKRIFSQTLGEGGVETLPEVSEQVFNSLKTSLGTMRQAETQLWNQVPEVPIVKTDALQATVGDLTTKKISMDALHRMLRIEDMPEHMQGGFKSMLESVEEANRGRNAPELSVDDIIDAYSEGGDTDLGEALSHLIGQRAANDSDTPSEIFNISSTDLIRIRTRSREIADSAFSGADPDRLLGSVARAIEMAANRDLMAIGDYASDAGTQFKTAFDEARGLSRNIHEIFGRTFAGKALSLTPTGAENISPELMLQLAYGSGGNKGAMNIRQILRASGSARGDNFSEAQVAAMGAPNPVVSSEQGVRSLVQAMAHDAGFDPKSPGRLNVDKLNNFIQRNRRLLDRTVNSRGQRLFEDIEGGFTDAATAEAKVQELMTEMDAYNKQIASTEYLSSLLDGQDPWEVVGRAMRSGDPENAMASLRETANAGKVEGRTGLRTAALDYAFNQSGKNLNLDSGTPQERAQALSQFWSRMDYTLRGTPRRGKPSLLDMLTSEDAEGHVIMDSGTAERLELILDRARGVSRSMSRGEELTIELGKESFLTDLITRMAGARLGASLAGNYAGAPLVAAGAGSRFARQIMQRMPLGKVNQVLIEAAENPKLMASLLERPTTVRETRDVLRQINAHLLAAGILNENESLLGESAIDDEYLDEDYMTDEEFEFAIPGEYEE